MLESLPVLFHFSNKIIYENSAHSQLAVTCSSTQSSMLPTAGLFLPETLHRREDPREEKMETEGPRLRLFQRQNGRTRPGFGSSSSTPSLAHRDSLEDDSNGYSSISVAYDYADFVSISRKGPLDPGSLATLIHRVRKDLTEASRLYLCPAVKSFLDAWPDQRSWIDVTLRDIRYSLSDIGTYIQASPIISDENGAKILRRKFDWVLRHQRRLANKQQLLSACHEGLIKAITTMHTAELCGVTNGIYQEQVFEAPVQPWVKREDSHLLRGPYSRRESRLSQKNMTSSTVSLSLTEKDSTDGMY